MTPPQKTTWGMTLFPGREPGHRGNIPPEKKASKKGNNGNVKLPPSQKNNGGASVFLGTCVDAQQHQTRTDKETKENENMNARNVPPPKKQCVC